jgi:hypothetical protein
MSAVQRKIGSPNSSSHQSSCLPLRGLTIPLYTTTNRVSRFPSQHLKVLAEIFKAPVHPGARRVERHPLVDMGDRSSNFAPPERRKPGYWYNWYMAPRDITMARRDPGAPCGYLPTVPEILTATPAQAAGVLRWTPNVHLLPGVPLELVSSYVLGRQPTAVQHLPVALVFERRRRHDSILCLRSLGRPLDRKRPIIFVGND